MDRKETGESDGLRLAAILRSEHCNADQILSCVARQLKQNGYRVGGAIQSNEHGPDVHPCDIVLEELVSGETVALALEMGPETEVCQLDPAKLERVAGMVDTTLDEGLDVLILNKFGKREAAGSGLYGTIAKAASAEIPVLISVSQEQRAAWDTFCGGEGQILKPDTNAVMTWLTDTLTDIQNS